MKKIMSILLVLTLMVFLTGCDFDILKLNEKTTTETTTKKPDTTEEIIPSVINGDFLDEKYDNFDIHFFTLGTDKAGDSIYIKAGLTDILIDAGASKSNTDTNINYIKNYVEDGTLEYVIATHGDSDHISGFPKIFDNFNVNTIIDFQYTNKTTQTYANYITARDKLVENGTKHYFASECFNLQNGANRKYQLSKYVSMEILYNEYYFKTNDDENNYSVCCMFTYSNGIDDTRNFMFTGDLEKEGEESLANYYDGSSLEKTLPKVDFYKAGHHGSKTSSNDCLLNIIQPKMCVVPCCCGTNEYTDILDNQFPTQAFINRISKWTDEVYIPSTFESYTIVKNNDNEEIIKTSGYKDMNGNIIISCLMDENKVLNVTKTFSNNDIKLKDSEWFNATITLNGETRTFRKKPQNWQ